MTLFLYDPRTNVKTEISMDALKGLAGRKKSELLSIKAKGHKLRNLNCYIVDESFSNQQRRTCYEKEKFHDEAWKKINGYPGLYEISNYGRVKSYHTKQGRLLLPIYRKDSGYLFISLHKDGAEKHVSIGSLVASHFVGKKKPGEVLKYRNRIKTDNFSANLEYVPKKEIIHSVIRATRSRPVVQLERETFTFIDEYPSIREAGRKCFLDATTIHHNLNKRTKSAGGFVFMYSDEYENQFGKEAFQ